ncbi:T9SS sorting signal type C domain-containing protein [Flavobacterium sp. Sd200]|uniref:choice-of-anchor Q domain-containing protein n=1 Tax=Flavobacterium sp. Sd200 TaxID=2692211 RepID=UPI00136B19FB|nr:choice-of-anchor Q domain-containing protein [Flavobacterium sp. Sd200]MXN92380.1 T9SS sorting signal type C domain-containing protein [Flavobacterium sp. Sd200]
MDVNFTIIKRQSILLYVFLLFSTTLFAQTIRYVKQGATGSGSSWANASGDLQAMINESSAGSEVWVAAGTYQRSSGQSFSMRNGVKIYGGFPAVGTPGFEERDWQNNMTVLRGNQASVVINYNLNNTALLDGFKIAFGSATYGGGIYNNNSSPVITNILFDRNSATYGGGIYNLNSTASIYNVLIIGSIASQNGSAIYNSNSNVHLTNAIITFNYSTGLGDALYNNSSSPILTNITITANRSPNANGALIYNLNSYPEIRNSIIYNNPSRIVNENSQPSISYSLVQGMAADPANNNLDGSIDPLFINPNLVGELPGNYGVSSVSPVINMGNSSFYNESQTPNLSYITTDYLGNSRIAGSFIDMGAYEFNPDKIMRFVKQGGTGNGTSWQNASGDLQRIINDAGYGREVWVAAGTYQLASGSFYTMKDGVKIYGGFPDSGNPTMAERNWQNNVTTLRGNNNSIIRNDNNFVTNTAVLDGFTLTGGGNLGGAHRGGAIYNNNTSPILNNLIITQNSANYGGGIFNQNSSPVMNNLSITNNVATFGGAMDNQSSFITLTNSKISGNFAESSGGGLYNISTSTILTNVTIKGNSANGVSAINNYAGTHTVTNTAVTGNSSLTGYSALTYSNNSPVLTNVTISGNLGGDRENILMFTNSSPKIRNSVIYNNSSGIQNNNSVPEISYSLIQEMEENTANNNFAGTTNPMFINSLSPGLSEEGNYNLQSGSPLINAGNNYFLAGQSPDLSHIISDAALNPRLIANNIEIGAYEYMDPAEINIRYVKEGATGSGFSWENPSGDLQAMINASASGNEVWVASGNYQPASGQSFSMKEGVKIYGGFPNTGSPSMGDRNWSNNISTLLGNEGPVISNSRNGLTLTSVLDGFTITGGNGYHGGGIFNWEVSPTLNNLYIHSNNGVYGGGVCNYSSSPHMYNINISNNVATTAAGGIYNIGSESLIIANALISNNSGGAGGGIMNHSCVSVFIRNTVLTGNTAGDGGAIVSYDCTSLVFTNLSIVGNHSSTYNGGGILNGNSSPYITNCTFSNNVGRAIYNYNNSVPQIRNTIISGNDTGIYNISGSSAGIFYSIVQGVSADANNHNLDGSLDPMFADAANGNYALHPYSPAANTGSNDYYAAGLTPDLNAVTTDISGNARFYNNGTIDMGAYELQETPVVNIRYVKEGGMGNGYTWQNASGNLQAMINASVVGNEVWVAAGTYLPAVDQAFSMKEGVKIYGGFPATGNPSIGERNWASNPTVLYGNSWRVITNYNNGLTNASVLDGFTITGGANVGQGAGIYNANAHPVIKNCIFRNNVSYEWGGGMYDAGAGEPTLVINCLFSGNSGSGGAVFADVGSSIKFYNCTLANNTGGNGGALHTYQNAAPSLYNCILWGNTVPYDTGSQIYSSVGGSVNIQNCIIEQGTNDIAGPNTADNILDINPMFADVAYGNYNLQVVSPAINAGNNEYYAAGLTPDLSSVITDLSVNSRIYNNQVIDLGAFEYQGNTECTVTTVWNGSNWDNGVPQSVAYRAIIEGDLNSSQNITACSLEVIAGNTVINTGHTFTIKGAVDVFEGSSLTVNNNAALVQLDNVTNTGSITVHKDSNSLYRLDYTMWSSPVAGQNLLAFSPQTTIGRFYRYGYDYDAEAGAFLEQYWTVDAAATNFEPATGYLIRMPNGNATPGYNAGTTPITFTGTFNGVPNNGDVNYPFYYGNRYVAVGNPYPSPISVVDFFNENVSMINPTSALYFWRKRNNADAPSYAALTLAGYIANVAGGGDLGQGDYYTGNNENWHIVQGQGFIIRTRIDTSGVYIKFKNDMRRQAAATGNQPFFRTAQNNASGVWLNLTNGQDGFSQTAIVYMDNTTLGLDYGYDGQQFNDDSSISIYSIAEETNLSIQARSQFQVNDVAPLGFRTNISGTFSIAIDHSSGLFLQGQDIYIKDNVLGTVTSLENAYVFTSGAGVFNDRFEIVYAANVLGNNNTKFEPDSVIVFKDGNTISIKTATALINDVTIYDTRGRKLYTKEGINSTETVLNGLQIQQQMILVEINTNKGTVSKKVIF